MQLRQRTDHLLNESLCVLHALFTLLEDLLNVGSHTPFDTRSELSFRRDISRVVPEKWKQRKPHHRNSRTR